MASLDCCTDELIKKRTTLDFIQAKGFVVEWLGDPWRSFLTGSHVIWPQNDGRSCSRPLWSFPYEPTVAFEERKQR